VFGCLLYAGVHLNWR